MPLFFFFARAFLRVATAKKFFACQPIPRKAALAAQKQRG
jgi:hypothetical protein